MQIICECKNQLTIKGPMLGSLGQDTKNTLGDSLIFDENFNNCMLSLTNQTSLLNIIDKATT